MFETCLVFHVSYARNTSCLQSLTQTGGFFPAVSQFVFGAYPIHIFAKSPAISLHLLVWGLVTYKP